MQFNYLIQHCPGPLLIACARITSSSSTQLLYKIVHYLTLYLQGFELRVQWFVLKEKCLLFNVQCIEGPHVSHFCCNWSAMLESGIYKEIYLQCLELLLYVNVLLKAPLGSRQLKDDDTYHASLMVEYVIGIQSPTYILAFMTTQESVRASLTFL